jgi:transcriptional regulator with XRE-family HTH domain/dephospho-CoA kinase
MIKNERQYRITKSQAQKFDHAIYELEANEQQQGLDPLLYQAQINALRSQLRDLQADLSQYDALREGGKPSYDFAQFEQIPSALIQSRIAQGLTQEELAQRLGLQPQQIQRYEANDYQSASLSRVADVIRALNLPIPKGMDAPSRAFSLANLTGRLKAFGIEEEFLRRRLLPRRAGTTTAAEGSQEDEIALEAAEGLSRIYGWNAEMLLGSDLLTNRSSAAATARFKLPSRVNAIQLGAYTVYAHYLALLVLEATTHINAFPLPTDAALVRATIVATYGDLNFQTGLRYIWSLGVPILPLNDPGTFHGACWRVRGRNVIVLKQRTRSAARWLFDLLHEYFHAASNPHLKEHLVIEESEMSPSRRQSEEEQSASRFAGDVLLDGRAEEFAETCVTVAKGSVERLKSAVVTVSKREGLSIDVLANYMAFRLSLQDINWWGAANNLQQDGSAMLCSPRGMLLDNADLTRLTPIDRNLLLRALEPVVLAFCGKVASGKSTLATEVAKALDWKRTSFGDYVRVVASSQGLEASREVLQDLGESLVKTPEAFSRAMLAHFGWQAGEPLIIDGVRHREVVEALRKIVAPLEFRLIFVDLPDEQRHDRLVRAGDADAERMPRIEKHSTEKQVSTVLRNIADLKVSSADGVGNVVQEIVSWVHQAESSTERAA